MSFSILAKDHAIVPILIILEIISFFKTIFEINVFKRIMNPFRILLIFYSLSILCVCGFLLNFLALVVLAGFGNLPGNVEIWDVSKKEKLANIKCPDTTHFEWNPNGEYFVTATTAPRLRIGNG